MVIDLTAVQEQMLRECVRHSRLREAGKAGAHQREATECYELADRDHNNPSLRAQGDVHAEKRINHLNQGQALAVLLAKIDQVIADYEHMASRLGLDELATQAHELGTGD